MSEYKNERIDRLLDLIEEAHRDKHCDHDTPHKYILYTYLECSRCFDYNVELNAIQKSSPVYAFVGFFQDLAYVIADFVMFKIFRRETKNCDESESSYHD